MSRIIKDSQKIDAYLARFPEVVQDILQKLRHAVREVTPAATESLSYGVIGYKLNGPLLYFGAFKHHIGFYPTPSGITAFKKELHGYDVVKGSVRFSLEQPLPWSLISKMIKFRVNENLAKQKEK